MYDMKRTTMGPFLLLEDPHDLIWTQVFWVNIPVFTIGNHMFRVLKWVWYF